MSIMNPFPNITPIKWCAIAVYAGVAWALVAGTIYVIWPLVQMIYGFVWWVS